MRNCVWTRARLADDALELVVGEDGEHGAVTDDGGATGVGVGAVGGGG